MRLLVLQKARPKACTTRAAHCWRASLRKECQAEPRRCLLAEDPLVSTGHTNDVADASQGPNKRGHLNIERSRKTGIMQRIIEWIEETASTPAPKQSYTRGTMKGYYAYPERRIREPPTFTHHSFASARARTSGSPGRDTPPSTWQPDPPPKSHAKASGNASRAHGGFVRVLIPRAGEPASIRANFCPRLKPGADGVDVDGLLHWRLGL